LGATSRREWPNTGRREAETLLTKLLSAFGISSHEQNRIIASFFSARGTAVIFRPPGLIIETDRPDITFYADDDKWGMAKANRK